MPVRKKENAVTAYIIIEKWENYQLATSQMTLKKPMIEVSGDS